MNVRRKKKKAPEDEKMQENFFLKCNISDDISVTAAFIN
jgi:hypothetical protein